MAPKSEWDKERQMCVSRIHAGRWFLLREKVLQDPHLADGNEHNC